MTKLVAVSLSTHAQKVWRRPGSYQFAAKEALVPILLAEVVLVGAWMPIAFIAQAGHFVPMAMMSPVPERNFFVGPAGQWLAGHVPSLLRSYPFRLVRREGSEQMTLCIDEDSGLVADASEKGEAFCAADGKPSQAIASLMEFLRQIEENRVATELAMAALAEANLLEPWPLTVDVDGNKAAVNGLYRVSDSALSKLDEAPFLKLRKTSGLHLAYAQIMSMQQIARFDQASQLAQTARFMPQELRFD